MDTKDTDTRKDALICYIESIQSLYPDNINTAEVLRIGKPCVVADAYAIICDRKNFKTVEIGSHTDRYTVQEIRNMSVHEQLGHGKGHPGFWMDLGEPTLINMAPVPAPPTPETTYETTAYQGIWQQTPNILEDLAEMIRRTQQIQRPTLAEINQQRARVNEFFWGDPRAIADTYTEPF